jgi:hypothetical protein
VSFQINIGFLGYIAFATAMILAAIAIFDLLTPANTSVKRKARAPALLVGAIGVLVVPYFAGIGRSISEPWGNLLPMCFLVFVFFMVLINRRSQKETSDI